MKRQSLLFVSLLFALCSMGQQLKFALVKDEGGITNIRKGPGANYGVVETIDDGFFVNVVATKGAWTKVYTTYTDGSKQDFIGYISTSKLIYPKRQGEYKQVAHVKDEGGYTNIRKGPGMDYVVTGKVKDGSYILVDCRYGEAWHRVYTQQGRLRGYISDSKIEMLESPQF